MRDRLFMRIDQDFPAKVSWFRVGASSDRRCSQSRGSLMDAATEASACQLIVLVPGADVLLSQVAVPSRQRQHIINAVPFALEDQLASDIDELHFALGPRNKEGVVPVAIVAREKMTAWLHQLREAGLDPHIMLPDVLALPWQENTWTLLHDDQLVLVRKNIYNAAVIDALAFNAWLELALNEAGEDKPKNIQLLEYQQDSKAGLKVNIADAVTDEMPDNADEKPVSSEILIEVVEPSGDPLQLFAENFSADNCLNLIQGEYSRREQIGRLLRPWRLAAAFVLVLSLLAVGKSVGDYIALNNLNTQLRAEINQIYLDTFPKARKVVNARLQMERKLSALKISSGTDNTRGFLPILAMIGKPLKGIEGADLRHVTYQDGRLNLSLRIKSLQLLEKLKIELLKNKNINVDIKSASSRDEYVDARLQLWQKGT